MNDKLTLAILKNRTFLKTPTNNKREIHAIKSHTKNLQKKKITKAK